MISRFQANHQRLNLSQLALKGILATILGMSLIACSDAARVEPVTDANASQAKSSAQAKANGASDGDSRSKRDATSAELVSQSSGNASSAHTENVLAQGDTHYIETGADGEPDEPLTANIERLNLQPDTPYGEVRSRVMAEGWIPYTQADGATPDIPNTRYLHELGFEEAQSCSGTGQGFCLFEFKHINDIAFPQARLVIITTPSADMYGEPKFYDWRIDNYEAVYSSARANESSPSGNFQYLEANATYENRNFSEALYAQVLEQEQDCVLLGECANAKYLFKDALFTLTPGEFGSYTTAVIPHNNVSRARAMTYARMLDTEGVIDFSDSNVFDNNEGEAVEPIQITESFFEASASDEGIAYEQASTKMVRLINRPGADISRIELELVVF